MSVRVGYLIGAHVAYLPKATPVLLESMDANGIDHKNIVVVVNGSLNSHVVWADEIYWSFVTHERQSPFATLVSDRSIKDRGIEYWFFLNCTCRCGPKFKELVEGGFNPDADATVAGGLLPLSHRGGVDGRAINDMAMYRYSYLVNGREKITAIDIGDLASEGILYAHAPRQAHYPTTGNQVTGPTDVYGTGTNRITEYYPGVDLYRYKKNWGNLAVGNYRLAAL